MEVRIPLKEEKARTILNELAKQFGYRFIQITNNEVSMRYNYFDDEGVKRSSDVKVRASEDNSKIIVYVNKRNFEKIQLDIVALDVVKSVKDYIEQIEPHITYDLLLFYF